MTRHRAAIGALHCLREPAEDESAVACPLDCPPPPTCGDGFCSACVGERCGLCPGDCTCGTTCDGDDECEPLAGEDRASCQADCGVRARP